MGKILYKGPIGKIWRGGAERGDELCELMIERAQRCHDLLSSGVPFEEMQNRVEEEFGERMDKILYPKGHPVKKKIKLTLQPDGTFATEWSPYLKILDHIRPTIEKRALYSRLLVQAQFWFRFVMDDVGIYVDINPNYAVYPNGIEITEEMLEYLQAVYEDNDFEISE